MSENGRQFSSIFKSLTQRKIKKTYEKDLKISDSSSNSESEGQENYTENSINRQSEQRKSKRKIDRTLNRSCTNQAKRTKQIKSSYPKLKNLQKTSTMNGINVLQENANASRLSCCQHQQVLPPLAVNSLQRVRSVVDEEIEAESEIAWSSSPTSSDDNDEQKSSQKIDTPTTSQKSTPPTELELLINLVTREKEAYKKLKIANEHKKKKRFRLNRYLDLYHRSMKKMLAYRKFLEEDKKISKRLGWPVEVIDLKIDFALVSAIVLDENEKKFAIILDEDIASKVEIGSKLEAFYDDQATPREIEIDGEVFTYFGQPYKLVVV